MIQTAKARQRPLTLSALPPEGPTVRVLLPAYNEEDALPPMLDALRDTFDALKVPYQVTVVDDGSTDATAQIAAQAAATMPVSLKQHRTNQGLAAAMRSGLLHVLRDADAEDVIVTMDCDNTHPIGLIPRMIRGLQEGRDVIVASRFQPQSRVVGVTPFRQFTAWAAALLFRMLFPIRGVRDYTCGFRAYRATALQRAFDEYGDKFISEQGFACMVDILLKLARLQLICGEVPMVLRYDQKPGGSKMPVRRTIADSLRLACKRRVGILD